jgi:hypothetical protein
MPERPKVGASPHATAALLRSTVFHPKRSFRAAGRVNRDEARRRVWKGLTLDLPICGLRGVDRGV